MFLPEMEMEIEIEITRILLFMVLTDVARGVVYAFCNLDERPIGAD